MKKWPWRTILAITASSLTLAGVLPFAWCLWYAYGPRPEPLVMQFPSRAGEYTSVPFSAGFSGPSRIDLDWNPSTSEDEKKWLDLDWKIIDARHGIVQRGGFHSWTIGNTAILGGFPDGFRKGQKIVLTLPHDVRGMGTSMRLKVSVDTAERGLDMSYAWGIAVGWAIIFAGPGTLLLILVAVWKVRSDRAVSMKT